MPGARLLVACSVAVAAAGLLVWMLRGHDTEGAGDAATTPGVGPSAPAAPAPPAGTAAPPQTNVVPAGTKAAQTAGEPVETDAGSSIAGAKVGGPPAGGAAPEPVAQLPVYLDREMVRGLMADRVALAEALEPVEKTVEGYRMLRLARTAPEDLFTLLGLETGDVIVMVNEQSVHEGDNPLWDLLDREDEVRVWVMRQGRTARHFTYRFE